MAKFVMWGSYCEGALEKRGPYREAHLKGLTEQKAKGSANRARSNGGQHKSVWHLRSRE